MSEATRSKWGTIGTVACSQSAIGLVSAGGNAMGIVALAGGTATGVSAIAGGSSRSAIPI